jgi:hypothetical protein
MNALLSLLLQLLLLLLSRDTDLAIERSDDGDRTGFSRLSFGGLRDRMCPGPCGTTASSGSIPFQPASQSV